MLAKNCEISPSSSWTLFPVKQKNEIISFYASDFSEELGNSVYKGYACSLIKPNLTDLKPRHVKKEDIFIKNDQAVSIKVYDGVHHPSPYQMYSSERAVLHIEGRDVLIMDFIDGFHIYPDASKNPKLKELTFFQAADICWQLILGLNHLHYKNTSGSSIVHGDIKGENIKIRIRQIGDTDNKRFKVDVFYLDLDYAKPIVNVPQLSQGTSEHTAIEILDGCYSESSDFFALSPILLSIFGARNPLQKIIVFRAKHHLEHPELIKKMRDMNFSTDGIFEHFEKKPDAFICNLLKNFIVQMAEKNKEYRPTANAILEFFTALRQLCLIEELKEQSDTYRLRLSIAAQDEHWMKSQTNIILFFNLETNLQKRLISLMNSPQCVQFYIIAKQSNARLAIIHEIRDTAVHHLRAKIEILRNAIPASMFTESVTSKEIQWLLKCYELQDAENFNSHKNKKKRNKLELCTKKDISSLITIIIDGMNQTRSCSFGIY